MHSGPLYPQPMSTRCLGILPLSLARTVVFEQCKWRGMHTVNNLWFSPGLLQRNYLAIWQNSPEAQEAGWGNSEESASPGVRRPPPPLRQGRLPRAEKEGNLCPFFSVQRSICRTETNQSQLWKMKGGKAGKCSLLWLGKTLLKKIKKREKLIPYGRQMKYKCKTGHYAVSVVRLPHWGLCSSVKMQCPWNLWRRPSTLRQG